MSLETFTSRSVISPESHEEKDYPVDIEANKREIEQDLKEKNETVKTRACRFIDILEQVSSSRWRLVKITSNFRYGASIYGYFLSDDIKNKNDAICKVRLSDHGGRWSNASLDLRNPKDAKTIECFLNDFRRTSVQQVH